ncbi:hypothetical protein ACRAJ3_19615 [Rhodococcus pyridinivorans]|uniref:hypothetical protein n=1 Tax=Rhodococcus pyridinivorans TaxID=103816 RepID=UPI003D7FFB76
MTTPLIQRLGDAVLLQGRAVDAAYLAAAATIAQLSERDAPIPAPLSSLLAVCRDASTNRHDDDALPVIPAPSEQIDTHEAAKLLDRTPRSIQRIARSLDGRKLNGTWIFDRATVLEYRTMRDTHERVS